ncbi:hypothetical protein ACTMTJ_41050 [Phytohabitans sp. LJ34]|uniref:hypothetical protein n=1 Tax=Phytohabitans sp. LJ34 TaxID=3452217 RepID=UPI003F89558F
MTWVMPDACTLPVAEHPLRLDELDRLFASAVREQRRVSGQHLQLVLVGDNDVEAVTRDLVRRESTCCAFFEFAVERQREGLIVDIRVPDGQTAVLDGLVHRVSLARGADT